MKLARYRVDGSALREAREEALLSGYELTQLSSVSVDTIYKLECENRTAHGKTVRKLAKALECHHKELLMEVDDRRDEIIREKGDDG